MNSEILTTLTVNKTRCTIAAVSLADLMLGVWNHNVWLVGGGGAGMLTSAGKVLFTGDGNGNFVAFDAPTGKLLWHSRIGNISNAPETYLLDGKQYVLVAVGDTLYSFTLY